MYLSGGYNMLAAINSFSGFSVSDINKARNFYVDTLDFELKDDSMGLLLKLPGDGEVFIYQKEDHQPATFTVLNFVVDDIDDTVDHLKTHGINFEVYDNLPASQDDKGILRGKEAGQGPNIAWFKDPDGNILSVVEN